VHANEKVGEKQMLDQPHAFADARPVACLTLASSTTTKEASARHAAGSASANTTAKDTSAGRRRTSICELSTTFGPLLVSSHLVIRDNP
jgi:hypothetical protein